MTNVSLTHVAGVLSLGRDSLAATVSQFLPDFLLLHPADTSQDAPSRLAAAGTGSAQSKMPHSLALVPEIVLRQRNVLM